MQLAFGTTFRITVGYKKAGTSSLALRKELLEGFSKLERDFLEASRNLDFLQKRNNQKL
jgi:hypothetical protein